jgi:hypothetical protein
MYAAWNGDMKLVQRLLVMGADINAKNKHGMTPLLGAVISNKEEMVTFLLTEGAAPAAVSEKGRTAIDYADENMHLVLPGGGDTFLRMPDITGRQIATRIKAALDAALAHPVVKTSARRQENLRQSAPKFRLGGGR